MRSAEEKGGATRGKGDLKQFLQKMGKFRGPCVVHGKPASQGFCAHALPRCKRQLNWETPV